jgi:hypothetical protein
MRAYQELVLRFCRAVDSAESHRVSQPQDANDKR